MARRKPTRALRWYEGPIPIVGTVAVILATVIGLILWSRSAPAASAPPPAAAAAIVAGITSLDPASSLGVAAGGLKNPLKPTGATVTRLPDGRIQVTYVGAEYCPYCAAERWSLLVALSRFGTFSGVELSQSSSTDIYPNTPTFTFTHATFTSSSVAFAAFETADRNGQPLQPLSTEAKGSLAKYDSGGSIPFLEIAGLNYEVGAGFVPDAFTGNDWQQILTQVRNPQSVIGRQVIGNANWLTAAICRAGGQAAACSDPHIQSLQAQLGP